MSGKEVMFRKPRIAFLVMCGIVCLLFAALWVRSYWSVDLVFYRPAVSTMWVAWAGNGAVGVAWGDSVDDLGTPPIGWTQLTESRPRLFPLEGPLIANIFRAFDRPRPDELQMPIWIFVLVTAAIASAPWFRWRYSLRTLLIATTLVAVGLGVIVDALR